jgi:hypothetical protein
MKQRAARVLLAALAAGAAAGDAQSVVRYALAVETEQDARIQGTVFAAGQRWICLGNRCTGHEIGRAASASLQRCRELSAEVGRVRSYFDGVGRLGESELAECNRAARGTAGAAAASAGDIATAHGARLSQRFSLVQQADAYWLRDAGGERHRVPSDWIVPAAEAALERESIVSSTAFGPDVQEFALGDGLIALRLASYAIAGGSAQAAAGRDVFLLFDDGPRKALLDGGLRLGITRSRVRLGGSQWRATSVRFYLGGSRGGAPTDLGVLQEQVRCGPGGHAGPQFSAGRVQWYELRDRRWVSAEAPRGEPESSSRHELPLADLHKSPVQFVTEVCSGLTGRP